MLDRFTGMRVFARVAQAGSLSAAARGLGLSQTMVTKHVLALEERLGVKLLHRTTRRLTLTEPGRRYLDVCERILSDLAEAEEAIARDRVEVRGTLRLAVPVVFGVREIGPVLGAFADLHPGVGIDVGLNDRLVDLVEEGWDMAVRIGRLGDSSLVARRLAPCRMLLCAAPAYLERRGVPRTLADLAGHDALGYTLPAPAAAERWQLGAAGDLSVPVRVRCRANNGDALLALGLAGQGLLYQPTFIVGDAVRQGLLTVLELDHPPRRDLAVHAVMPPGRSPPAKVRAFVELLVRYFWPEPPWDRGLPSDSNP